MAFNVAKQEFKGTKLDGPAMAAGIQPATITSIKDLGMVPVSPLYRREGSPAETRQAEFVFTGPNGGQAKKSATVSLHEKSFIFKLIVAVTGKPPADNFDLDSLLDKNLTLLIETKTSARGTAYAKVTGVAPASPRQPVYAAPASKTPAANPVPASVGW